MQEKARGAGLNGKLAQIEGEVAEEEKKTDAAVAEMTGEQIASMTKEEALEFLGLPADADKEALENRFWQLSKKYRSLKQPLQIKNVE